MVLTFEPFHLSTEASTPYRLTLLHFSVATS